MNSSLYFIIILISSSLYAQVSNPRYIVNQKIQAQELTLALSVLSSDQNPQVLTKLKEITKLINQYAQQIELTNLELVIKAEFYKSFLNFYSKSVEQQKALGPQEINQIPLKVQTLLPESFSHWFITSLLGDYKNITAKQQLYLSSWLSSFLKLTPSKWDALINKAIFKYLDQLKEVLQVTSRYGRNERAALSTLSGDELIIFEEIAQTKSQAIDFIDKKLEENMQNTP